MAHEQQRIDPAAAAMAGLATTQEIVGHTHGMVRKLCELIDGQLTPPTWSYIVLEPTTPRETDDPRDPSSAITVVNPNPVVVRLGLAGGSAAQGARGFPVAANGWVTLPGWWDSVEFGPDDPALLVSNAVLWLARWKTVQPFAAGVIA